MKSPKYPCRFPAPCGSNSHSTFPGSHSFYPSRFRVPRKLIDSPKATEWQTWDGPFPSWCFSTTSGCHLSKSPWSAVRVIMENYTTNYTTSNRDHPCSGNETWWREYYLVLHILGGFFWRIHNKYALDLWFLKIKRNCIWCLFLPFQKQFRGEHCVTQGGVFLSIVIHWQKWHKILFCGCYSSAWLSLSLCSF